MANPANPGTFDFTITDTIDFWVLPPRSGSTGDFDRTITDRIDFDVYVEAAAAAGVTKQMMYYARLRRTA